MLTIGKSNYFRFNNNSQTEVQIKQSSSVSHKRISMPKIDFKQSFGSSNGGSCNTSDVEVFNNLNDISDTTQPSEQASSKPATHQNNSSNLLQNLTKIEYTNVNNFHSPKVFTADSIKVNTPAKDVLGPKFNNFTRNLTQLFKRNEINLDQNRHKNDLHGPNNTMVSGGANQKAINSSANTMPIEKAVLTKVNNSAANNSHLIATISNGSVSPPVKLQPTSACYDRYPKPGSYGSLQVFPMNGVNSEINNVNVKEQVNVELQRHRAQIEQMQEIEMSTVEQDRLEEILKMCAEFERQNIQSSPIVQNRIKTNGSLPRDKKSPFADQNKTNIFFPPSPSDMRQSNQQNVTQQLQSARSTGYENVRQLPGRRVELLSSPSSRYENISLQQHQQMSSSSPCDSLNANVSSGYENVMGIRKSPAGYVPQSPRTRIKTCISPKKELTSTPIQRKTDYDLLVESFEEKLRQEIQQLRENHNVESYKNHNGHAIGQNNAQNTQQSPPSPQSAQQNHQYSNTNRPIDMQEGIYGTLTSKKKNINNLTVNIKKNLDEKQILQLKRQRVDVLNNVRELKAQIAELQRQEEEVLRELDLEKALVSAELSTEQTYLIEMQKSLSALQAKIHRLEAQRNANRVLQETQQNKLKQSIDLKQNQVQGLKKFIAANTFNEALKDELNQTVNLLENDTKTFEDLEFQYLEEETEWLAYREELHNEQKTLSRRIEEKRKHIHALEGQGIDNQNTACADTKSIEKDLWLMLSELEKCREELKTIDTLLFELSGQKNTPSDSDEDYPMAMTTKRTFSDVMSQSLFGSQEILCSKQIQPTDLMSKSVNENLFSNKIETLSFTESNTYMDKANGASYENVDIKQPMKINTNSNNIDIKSMKRLNDSGKQSAYDEKPTKDEDITDPLQKLKYNLSPPFDHKAVTVDDAQNKSGVNLNLSIESDDFEVNPLEKRVPSQDDIDRICKVTLDAPISTQGASFKVIESIKEIERNRQLLLAQQGSHVIEHERQKMNELKKKSHDEARAQYLQLQNHSDDSYRNESGYLEGLDNGKSDNAGDSEKRAENSPTQYKSTTHREVLSSPQRHSHPDFERERPLSEANSELSYDALSEKPFKSTNDIRLSNGRIHQDPEGNSSQRGSMLSSENSESGRMVSGSKRNLPKQQRPLTRYLPIMSADLDLRLHIESAGHQVNLCPHLVVDSYSCRGYLHKLGATFHGWSRRWFVLDRQKMALIYYSDKSERKPRGGAYFSTIDEVYLDHLNTSKSGRPHCTFIVKTKRRSYHLQAASDATARIWIDAIITGAQGNIDY